MEERLILVRERDVDHDWYRDGEEPVAQSGSEFPRVVRGEVLEDEGLVDSCYLLELRAR